MYFKNVIFVAKTCKYGIFVAKMGKYGIFVAKFCKYALIDSFQGYAAVIDSSANCAALLTSLGLPLSNKDSVVRLFICLGKTINRHFSSSNTDRNYDDSVIPKEK